MFDEYKEVIVTKWNYAAEKPVEVIKHVPVYRCPECGAEVDEPGEFCPKCKELYKVVEMTDMEFGDYLHKILDPDEIDFGFYKGYIEFVFNGTKERIELLKEALEWRGHNPDMKKYYDRYYLFWRLRLQNDI